PSDDVVEAVHAVDLLAEVGVLGLEPRVKLADFRQARPELGFRSFSIQGVREDLPHRPHAGHREVRPRPPRLERVRPDGADEAAPDGNGNDQDGLHSRPQRIAALRPGLIGQAIRQPLYSNALALEELRAEPWR